VSCYRVVLLDECEKLYKKEEMNVYRKDKKSKRCGIVENLVDGII